MMQMTEKIPPQIDVIVDRPLEENPEPIWVSDVPKSTDSSMEIEAPLHHDDIWETLWNDKVEGIQGG